MALRLYLYYSLLYYFAFIYIRFLNHKIMHVSYKNMNIVVYKYYKVKSLTLILYFPCWFSTWPQTRNTSFLYNLQENFNINIQALIFAYIFLKKKQCYSIHYMCFSVRPLPPPVTDVTNLSFSVCFGRQGALNSFTIARSPVLNYSCFP